MTFGYGNSQDQFISHFNAKIGQILGTSHNFASKLGNFQNSHRENAEF